MSAVTTILIIDNTFAFGGAINSLYNLIDAIDKSRFRIVLVTGQSHEVLARNPDIACYHIVPKLPWINNRHYSRIAKLPFFRRKAASRILNALRFLYWLALVYLPEALKYYDIGRRHHVDVVHLNNRIGTQFSAIIAAKLLRVPCMAHMRDFEKVQPWKQLFAHLVDHYVAISNAIRDNIRQLGVPDDKITLVYDAINIEVLQERKSKKPTDLSFHIPQGQSTFGIFGRVIEWKGIREFILAARQVINNIPEAVGFVVGDSSDSDAQFYHSMQQLASDLGLAGKVVFSGYHTDVFYLMGKIDVVVHASIQPEPFGMVIIEGMALGKPLVATRAGGPLDIVINNETGILVAPGCPDELSRAISLLLRRPDLRRKMGRAGYNRVKELFSSQRYAAQIEAIYQNLGGKG